MGLLLMPKQLERFAKLRMQLCGAVSRDRQSAALRWTIFRKGGNYYETAWFDGCQHFRHIGSAILLVGEKVKNRPVVPNIIRFTRQVGLQYIGFDPMNGICSRPNRSFAASSACFDKSSTVMLCNNRD